MRGMSSILSLFRNKFNKFNNTARILDSGGLCNVSNCDETKKTALNKQTVRTKELKKIPSSAFRPFNDQAPTLRLKIKVNVALEQLKRKPYSYKL